MVEFNYKSKFTVPVQEEYKQWLKKNYPGDYYDKYGGKKPFNRLSTVGKIGKVGGYAGLVGLVYELGKEVLSLGNIPNDLEEREQLRMGMIMNNVPKVVTAKDGTTSVELPDKQSLKDHLPYKKYISDVPDVSGGEEVQGVDYVLVDPYDEIYGPVNTEGYELTEYGYRRIPEKSTIEKISKGAKVVSSVIPPEIKDVTKKGLAFITGGAIGVDK